MPDDAFVMHFSLSKTFFDKLVAGEQAPVTARFCLNPADSGRKICKEAIFLAKINRVAAVHAASNDCSARGPKPSRALTGFFESL